MASDQWSTDVVAEIAALLSDAIGLAFRPSLRASAESGIRRAMNEAGFDSPRNYLQHLKTDQKLLDALISNLVIGETYFFRDRAQFDLIRYEMLPDLVRRLKPQQGVRIWSAGCASGEEAYSLAILLHQEKLLDRAVVIGTDVCKRAIARARAGIYREWSMRGQALEHVEPYVDPVGERWQIKPWLKRHVRFEYLNLARQRVPSYALGIYAMDLILCRNVLMYLQPEVIERTARGFFRTLTPHGWLLTAPSDPTLPAAAAIDFEATRRGAIYRRRPRTPPGTLATPLPTQQPEVPAPPARPSAPAQATSPAPSSPLSSTPEAALQALQDGDYQQVRQLTAGKGADPLAAELNIRAMAALEGTVPAAVAAADAVERHPLSLSLNYLHGTLLADIGRHEPAAQSFRRVLYLDNRQPMAHFALGTVLRLQTDTAGARRAFRNARDVCRTLPPDTGIALSDGLNAEQLADAAQGQLDLLDARES